MIRIVARTEFVLAWRDGRARLAAAFLVVLFLAAVADAVVRFEAVDAERQAAEEATYRQWLEQGEKNPHSAAHFGLYAFKAETLLAYVERGVNDHAGSVIWLEAHKRNRAEVRPAGDGDTTRLFGVLSPAQAMFALVPMLIILLCHGVWARERESGVLRQTLAAGASPRVLVLGKTLGASAAVLFLTLPVVGLVALAAGWTAPDGQVAIRALLMAGLCSTALLTWALLSIGVSALARTARGALLVLLGLWVLSVFLVPRLAFESARQLVPLPSAAATSERLARELRVDPVTGETQDAFLEKRTRELFAKHGVQRPEDLPVNLSGYRLNWSEDWGNRVFDRVWGGIDATLLRQERLTGWFALLSPTLPARQIAATLAETDLAGHLRFQQEAELYRRAFVWELNAYLAANSTTGQKFTAAADYWREIEPFKPSPDSLADSLAPYAWQGVAVLGWLVATALFALLAGNRVRPETA